MNMTKEQMKEMKGLMNDDRRCSITEYREEITVSFETEDKHHDYYIFSDDGAIINVLGTGWVSNSYSVIEGEV